MISSPINSLVQDTNFGISKVQNKYNVSDATVDFGKHFDKASQNVKSSYEDSKEKVNVDVSESSKKNTEKEKIDIDESTDAKDEIEKVNDFSKEDVTNDEDIDNTVSLKDSVAEELDEEISEVLCQIIEQIKAILGISDDELTNALENVGIQELDLFNPNNVPDLIMAITGAESSISFVADEDMYSSLQEVLQTVEAGVNSLMENTGLTSEELDLIFQEIKMIENTSLEETVEFMDDDISIEKAISTEGFVSEKSPVIISENTDITDIEAENDVIHDTIKTEDSSDKAKEEKRDFGQQNSFNNNFESTQSEITKLTSENSISTYTSESTEKIMRQIVDMMKVVKNEQLTEMELQLHPASLGNVKVSLATKGGVVTAEFITQNEAVKNAIEAQAVQLKANLEEQGVKIEAIEVSVASHQMERNLEQDNKDSSQSEREQDEKYVQGIRKNNINFNSFENGEELLDEFNGADDATRIAMEMMAINGNSMDIMA